MVLLTKHQVKWAKNREKVISMYESAKSSDESLRGIYEGIAQKLGLSPSFVRNTINDHEGRANR